MQDLHQNYFGYMSPERPQDISWLDGRINSALLEVVYIPGAADIRNTMESGETEIIERGQSTCLYPAKWKHFYAKSNGNL